MAANSYEFSYGKWSELDVARAIFLRSQRFSKIRKKSSLDGGVEMRRLALNSSTNFWHPLCLLVAGCLFLIAKAHALDPNRLISQYGHTVWRTDNGLVPASSFITQTTDGYIWIGSNSNLWRFDGVQFVPWQRPKGAEPLGTINHLLGARDGSLWIGMVARAARLKDGEISSYTKSTDIFGISDIIEDHAGNIWLTRYGAKSGLCEVVGGGLHCYGKQDGFPAEYGLGMAEDRAGNLWVAGSGKLFRWSPGTNASEYLGAVNQPRVDAVTVDPSGGVWAALEAAGPGAGVQYLRNGVWGDYSVDGFHSSNLRSANLFVDSAGAVWIGTVNDGLYRIWQGTVDHFSKNNGLSGDDVSCIFEDREGNLWISTDNGIDLFRNTPVITYSMDQGLSTDAALTVLALKDGTIWTGNYNAEERAGEEPASILQAPEQDRRFSLGPKVPGRIEALFQDRSGALWLSFGRSMAVYQHGRVERVIGQDRRPFSGTEITAVIEDSTGSILALSQTSLLRLRDRRVIDVIPLPRPLATSGYLALNPSGGVWIVGQREGLILYKDGNLKKVPLPDSKGPIRVRGAFADIADPLLLDTTIGLLRWDRNRWQILDEAKGLPCARIMGLAKDNHGSLWIQASCGLLKAEASELQQWRQNPKSPLSFTVFNALDGAQTGSIRVVQPTMSLAPDGRVWFANAHKVGVINPDNVYKNLLVPPVHVEQMIADGKTFASIGEPHIPPNPRNLEIDYTALSYSVPQRVRFRYLLENHDRDWQGPVTRRQAFYTDLAPGKYRFHVIACNNSGVWNNTGAVTEFVIQPTFYQTWWFRAGLVIMAAGLLWGLYLLRLKQAAATAQERILTQVQERERIARDLHDTLLQGFQGITLQVQGVAKKLNVQDPLRKTMEEVLDRADETLSEARQRVRKLRQRTTEEDELPKLIEKCGRELSQDHTANFVITIIGAQRRLESAVQDEAYDITVEALRNAFRHASASRIEVEIVYDSNFLRIRVRDDGVGVEEGLPANGRPGHWGLIGMHERAKAIRAELKVWSRAGTGTEIELVIPATLAFPRNAAAI